MRVLVIESRSEARENLIEILSWYGGIRSVHQAESARGVESMNDLPEIDAVIVGKLDHFTAEAAVRFARLRFNRSRLIAATAIEPGATSYEQLLAAGADGVIDLRMSIWKAGVVLRALLWKNARVDRQESGSNVPGLRLETA